MRSYLTLILLFCAKLSMACSCAPTPFNFCESIRYNEHVALVKVVSHQGQFMDVLILDEIRHSFSTDTITIIGQDGVNCSEWLDQFSISDTLILGLQDFSMADTFNLSFCGRYFLHYNNGMVTGNITPTSTAQSYTDFIADFDACAILGISDPKKTELYLHIIDRLATISHPSIQILSVRVFSQTGQLIHAVQNIGNRSVTIDLNALKPAIYLFEIETESGRIAMKKVVL